MPRTIAVNGRKGAPLPPIVADHVPREGELVMQETVGPIVPIVRVPDDEATMAGPNPTACGLSSGACTNDFRRMRVDIAGLGDSGNGDQEGDVQAMKSDTDVETFSLPW